MNDTEFETAARRRNCTGKTRYLCAPDKNLTSLIEFCTDRRKSLYENGMLVLGLFMSNGFQFCFEVMQDAIYPIEKNAIILLILCFIRGHLADV